MGSVLALALPNSPFMVPPPSSKSIVTPRYAGGATTKTSKGATRRQNPGSLDECHRKCKDVFPNQIEGVRLIVTKGLSNHFQVTHTVQLSPTADSSYRFGATYVGPTQSGPGEFYPVMVSDVDNSGSMNAQIIQQVAQRIRSKVAFQTQQHKFINWQADAEFKGEDFTATVMLGNPNILIGSGIVVAHYLQTITRSLALGAELVYHCRPGEEGAVVSFVGKYTGNNYVATATFSSAGAHLSYYHRANEKFILAQAPELRVGVEFEARTRMQETNVSFGYQVDIPKANLQFKGSVDSHWVVGSTLEKKLLPLPLSLLLCGSLNYRKNKFQCGIGATIG